jgi:hypothetical protein
LFLAHLRRRERGQLAGSAGSREAIGRIVGPRAPAGIAEQGAQRVAGDVSQQHEHRQQQGQPAERAEGDHRGEEHAETAHD